jgi:ABC-type branched-subunit amino acid transport system substrate-binding protein
MIFRSILFAFMILLFAESAFTQTNESALSGDDKIQVIDGKKYIIHVVLKKETLYAISKKYLINIEDLVATNPEINSIGLRAGQQIKIPVKESVKPLEALKPTSPPLLYSKPKKGGLLDTTSIKSLSKDSAKIKMDEILSRKDSSSLNTEYGVALLLPLNLYSETAHHPEKEENAAQENLSSSSHMGLEFYEGFKLAADSLQKEGLKARMYVYDTAGDTDRVNQLMAKPELKKNHLIIGPVAPVTSINKVARFCKDNSIIMVSPLANITKILTDNPFLVNVTPSVKTQCQQMSEFITDSFPEANIIVLNANSTKDIDLGNTFKQTISSLLKQRNSVLSKVSMINHADVSLKGVIEALSTTSKNVLIIPSSEEGFISVILSGLIPQIEKYKITVIGLPTWQKFETIDADIFQQLNTLVFNSFYVDYQNENTLKFRKKFRKLYKTEPSEYAYHGFDVGYYYLKALMTFGPSFLDFLPELKYPLMHTICDYERKNGLGGYENKYISILKFENFKMVKVNH